MSSDSNSAKTERLINLTMGLLAASRYLTKREIFEKISGYEGSAATKERMFERDKDELRQMGIEIEFIGDDPLFEDEAGYRISPKRFQFDSEKFTNEELLMMNQAIALWQSTNLEDIARSGLRRLASSGVSVLEDISGITDVDYELSDPLLPILWQAVSSRRNISFNYSKKNRSVKPYGLFLHQGSWYLVGEESKQTKRFKLSRFESLIEVSKKDNQFEVPKDFKIENFGFQNSPDIFDNHAVLEIVKGRQLPFTKNAELIKSANEKDTWKVFYEDETLFAQEILFYSEIVKVLEPDSLRRIVISALEVASK